MKQKERAAFIVKASYERLFEVMGPQGWWPGKTRFEIIVGAILTQNTAWTNVEKAIANLKAAKLLTPRSMHEAGIDALGALIRPAGYFNVKAKRLKNFTNHLFESYDGSLDKLLKKDAAKLRIELLDLNGIGPETADSIMLYAGGHPEFVVDAYTKRIFSRHKVVRKDARYDEVKKIFTDNIGCDAAVFNEYHALIVMTGKDYCKTKKPLCDVCPLKEYL